MYRRLLLVVLLCLPGFCLAIDEGKRTEQEPAFGETRAERPLIEAYEPNILGYRWPNDDVGFIDITVSLKYRLFPEHISLWTCPSGDGCQDRWRAYLGFTGQWGFYLGTRASDPVIGKSFNPKLFVRYTSDDDSSPLRSVAAIQYIPLTTVASPITSSGTNLIDSAIDLVSKVKEKYLQETDRCAFVMHRLTVARIRKLKASTAGSYLWTDAANGNPATLAGYPVYTCDAMGLSSSLNAFPILFGNWRRGYLLADRTGMQITLDPYSTPGQTRFYARRRVGGCVKSNDTIKALKIAVS